MKKDIKFSSSVFKNVSPEAKDLLRHLMTRDHNKRIDAKMALKHKWFKCKLDEKEIDLNFKKDIMNNLKNFQIEHKFQQAVCSYITHNLVSKKEIEDLRKIFKNLDLGGKGRISKEELQNGFRDTIGSVTEIELQKLMKSMDTDNNGYIEYEEFLKGAMGNKYLLSKENLLQAFNKFDIDKNGNISIEKIRSIIGGESAIDEEGFNIFLDEINLKKGEALTFEKFIGIMNNVKRRHTSYVTKKSK